jgi:2-methylcitrate dehydratase PrpD
VCLGLSVDQVENAFGICGQYMPVNAGELWEAGRRLAGLPTAKYEDCGINAQAGLMAALMAREGMTGTLKIFDPGSLLPGIARPGAVPNADALTEGLGKDWRLTRTSFKPWPSCRWFHYVLTALHLVLQKDKIAPSTVERIELFSSGASCHFSDPEIGDNIVMDASFSLPHSAAMMILGVPAGPQWFDPAIVRRDDVAALRRKVTVTLAPQTKEPASWGNAAEWGRPGAAMKVPSRAVVHAGGQTYEASSDFALGDGWSDTVRFTQDDVSRKFDVLATSLAPQSALWRQNVSRIASRIRRLEDVESVADLMRELSPLTFSAGAA